MATITDIYMDMDGVLCDFFHSLAGLVGTPHQEISDHVGPDGWLITDRLAAPYTKLELPQLLAHISAQPASFWEDMPVYPEAVEILKDIRVGSKCRLSILTRPCPEPNQACKEGKQAWADRHLHQFHPYIPIVFTEHKGPFAHPGAILIDDEPRNVEHFIAGGGQAFLWPQPWHKPTWPGMAHDHCRKFLRGQGVLQ